MIMWWVVGGGLRVGIWGGVVGVNVEGYLW